MLFGVLFLLLCAFCNVQALKTVRIEGELIESCDLTNSSDLALIIRSINSTHNINCDNSTVSINNAGEPADLKNSSICSISSYDKDGNLDRLVGVSVSTNRKHIICNLPQRQDGLDLISDVVTIENLKQANQTADLIYDFIIEYKKFDDECLNKWQGEALACKWFDEETKTWSGEGCNITETSITIENNPDMLGARCVCEHLTAFAILQETSRIEGKCEASVVIGNPVWIAFSVIYAVLLVCTVIQLRDIYLSNGCIFDFKTVVHILMIVICSFDMIINSALHGSAADPLQSGIPPEALGVFWATTYSMGFWVYALVVMAWAKIYHSISRSDDTPPEDLRSNRRVNIIYFCSCILITIVLLSLFITVAIMDNKDQVKNVVTAGSLFIGFVGIIEAIAFIIYGSLLVRRLQALSTKVIETTGDPTRDTYRPLAKHLFKVTVVISVAFVAESIIPIISVNSEMFVANFNTLQSLYVIFDTITLFTVLYLFYEVVRVENEYRLRRTFAIDECDDGIRTSTVEMERSRAYSGRTNGSRFSYPLSSFTPRLSNQFGSVDNGPKQAGPKQAGPVQKNSIRGSRVSGENRHLSLDSVVEADSPTLPTLVVV